MSDSKDKEKFIRGERMRFGRRERVAFHRMPSAQTDDPHIVHTRASRGYTHAFARVCLFIVLIFASLFAAAFYIIESGSLDRFLVTKANEQIRTAMPDGYHARVKDAALRLGSGLSLKLNVSGVNLIGPSEKQLASIGTLSFDIDPVSLIGGKVSVSSVQVDDIDIDSSTLPSTGTFSLTEYRVDSLPILVEQIFARTDLARGLLKAAETQSIHLSDIAFPVGSATPGKSVSVDIRDVYLYLLPEDVLRVDGEVSLDDTVTGFSLEATSDGARTQSLEADISNAKLTPFLLKQNRKGLATLGVDTTADMAIALERAAPGGGAPGARVEVDLSSGRFIVDAIARPFSDARLNLFYDTTKHSIELQDSSIDFDGSHFPFTAGILDLDRFKPGYEEPGYALDILVRGGRFKSREPGLPALIFDAKFAGEYQTNNPRLLLDNITVSSTQGIMAASFKAIFGEASPELSFGARIERMDTEAVKQLWPFWIARKPREWVSKNLHGGVITNGDIAVFLKEGRLKGAGVPLNLDETELNLVFDIDDTRITLNNKFPDVTRSDARVKIDGGRVDVEIEEGALNVGKGKTLTLSGGTFAIANSYVKPLTGEVDVIVSGAVQDLVTLADAPPINALKKTDFTPDDFSGTADVNIKARFPLDKPGPLPPNWSVVADVSEGALKKPLSGFAVADLSGLLEVVPDRLAFEGEGSANGVPLDVRWSAPLGAQDDQSPELWVAADLDDNEREKLVPGLGTYVSGPLSMTVENETDGNRITLDLKRTVLSLPWMGWKKPSGKPATLSFFVGKSNDDGVTVLEDLRLTGQGISARGQVEIDKSGLLSTTLTNVALSKGDNLNVAIQREKQGLDVVVTGRSFLAAPLIEHLTKSANDNGSGSGSNNDNVRLHVDIARVDGGAGRLLSGVAGDILVRRGDLSSGSLSATTATGKPVNLKLGAEGDAKTISLTTSGTGSLLRFAGIYQKMTGGTLELNLIETSTGWQGMLTLKSFRLLNDDQLKRILSSSAGANGKSLNATYHNQINETEQRFHLAQAVINLSDGVLQISDAFVRGDQVGATIKGVVRDAAGNIDMTGTFMPAYGLNRIFAEIPLFGPLLGNGNDKGLFGITFKLTGKTADPDLVVNPLSAIAPGVFRKIFEFQ